MCPCKIWILITSVHDIYCISIAMGVHWYPVTLVRRSQRSDRSGYVMGVSVDVYLQFYLHGISYRSCIYVCVLAQNSQHYEKPMHIRFVVPQISSTQRFRLSPSSTHPNSQVLSMHPYQIHGVPSPSLTVMKKYISNALDIFSGFVHICYLPRTNNKQIPWWWAYIFTYKGVGVSG